MTEATERFFESLPARAPEVLRGRVAGTIQIDLSCGNQTAHWLVRMRPGAIEVSRNRGPADAIWYSTEELFDRLVTGRAQAIAAVLRNESTFSGNVVLFLAFRAFFPDPPGTRDPREVARAQTGRPR
ncbi:SCP2 sterol-binding domain-containing protein [Micromonospora phytophila]|uniref:SCP2 sterol-binding domain-containing protein n=1 Tax=Micromonospora phytophila TaxID=709888 RepID=UPI00202EC66D|nr:SCP2 sterol-binding domain-containing protein [Micromonospora phytophila]MCM0674573.1 SCP2 sterol-binding domain-containing protein [Micromonospora phytophila]